jgi:membrane-bound lytic murein transglycosylase D
MAKSLLWIVAGAMACGVAGCEDSARNPVAYHPIQSPTPAPATLVIGTLPLSPDRPHLAALGAIPPDGVERLAAQVEAAFAAGQLEYQAGHLDGARQDFDRAMDLLLSSGFDVQGEPVLAALFDRVVTTANSDEMIAFREGDGFSEQKSEPAPLGEIAASVPASEGEAAAPIDPGLRTSAEGELQEVSHDLPLTVNDTVLSFLNYFQTTRGRAIVETGLRRAGRYRPMIQAVLREKGLPSDLMYMAQAESAFQPQALSSAGARGLWQFMSFRGKEYGLEHNWWVDDRQDPEKATRAAAAHLRDLYQMFGDWYLAMAAYDSGPVTVQRAVERTGYADFWELYKRNALPNETKNYVPIILALTLIAKDPARYGIDVEPEEPVRTDNVQPGHPIDLRLVAETIDVDLDTLRSLNPQLLRLVTPADANFVLHLPEGASDRFFAEIAAIPPEKWVSWRRHRVEQGETLSAIARQYHVTTAAIADVNGLDASAPLEMDERLIIPIATPAQASNGKLIRYRARMTDTLESIADEFDVTVPELKKWNGLRAGKITRGMLLKIYPGGLIPPPAVAPAGSPVVSASASNADAGAPPKQSAAGQSISYRVQPGETLWSIARAYMTTVEALRSANQYLFSRSLEAGDTLVILPR